MVSNDESCTFLRFGFSVTQGVAMARKKVMKLLKL